MGADKEKLKETNRKLDGGIAYADTMPNCIPYNGDTEITPGLTDVTIQPETWLENGLTIKAVEDVSPEVQEQKTIIADIATLLVGKAIDNQVIVGTEDLVDGVSPLEEGKLYLYVEG